MKFYVKSSLKVFVRIIAVIGIIISLCHLKGFFIDTNREDIYRQLLSKNSNYRVSVGTPGVDKFLEKYYYSKKIPSDMRSQTIKGLVLKWVAMGNNPPMSGTVHVEFVNGERTTSLCRLDELRQWSTETPFYAWLGWCLLATSVFAEIIIDIFDYKKRGLIKQNP